MTSSQGTREYLNKALSLLLAEDDDSLRETLSHFFSSQGFQVFQACSGTEAVEVALKKQIAFSVMDINMPGYSGIEALRFITRQRGGLLPCIFMSGDTSLEVMQKALGAGGFSFVSKPIQMELMQRSVDRLIHKFFRDLIPGTEWEKRTR